MDIKIDGKTSHIIDQLTDVLGLIIASIPDIDIRKAVAIYTANTIATAIKRHAEKNESNTLDRE